MELWQSISYSHPAEFIPLARAAEAAGFDGVTLAEHVFHPLHLKSRHPYSPADAPAFEVRELWSEVWSTCAAMAAVTSRLRVGSAVHVLPLHNPFHIAKALSTVAHISGNRVVAGVGSGWMKEEFDAFGVDFHRRGKRFDECIALMRALWSGEPVSFHGEFFDVDEALMLPGLETPVPIWIGGKSEAALKRAARLGDGWMGTGEPVEECLALVARLQEYRRQYGRDHLPFEIMSIQPWGGFDERDLERLKAAGVTAIKNWTFSFVIDTPNPSLAQRQDYLMRVGEGFRARFGR